MNPEIRPEGGPTASPALDRPPEEKRFSEEDRGELETLRAMSRSMQAYMRLVEGALLAAWKAGEADRGRLREADESELTAADRTARAAWEVAGEVVLRLPGR